MGLLKIIKYGHPLLREKATEVKSLGRTERDLIQAMAETMYQSRGIGLAATQVGVMQRLFVLDVDQHYDDEEEEEDETGLQKVPGLLRVFINPTITWESPEDEPYDEGCLSIPGVSAEVYRPSRVKIAARDENFEPFEIEANQLLARVIQHENDHLDGVMFVDKVARLKRTLLGGQLSRIKRDSLAELATLPDNYPVAL